MDTGRPVETRLGDALELLDISTTWYGGQYYTRPKMNQWIGWVELLQLIAGDFNHQSFQAVAPNADLELFTSNMAYGPRVSYQWSAAVHELRRDPGSRRAVLYVGKDEEPLAVRPCTSSIQFLIRDGKLRTVVSMRSWDIFKGMPYDIMMFSGFALATARLLDVPVGYVTVNAGSAHVYASDFDRIDHDEQNWGRHTMTFDNNIVPSFDVESLKDWAFDVDVDIRHLNKASRKTLLSDRGIIIS